MTEKYLNQPLIRIKENRYLKIMIFLLPMLNFLAGINIDIYAPSMPAIANHFNASIVMTKNTISVTMFGWMLGAMLFGILLDSVGRKKILFYCLLVYTIVSLCAPWCHSIHQLMLVRFIQGFSVASISIGCRALVVDTISGRLYTVAILYTSLGYGLGPIVGPVIGGVLQHTIGWRANFIALAVISLLLLILLVLIIEERMPVKKALHIKQIASCIGSVLSHRTFIAGAVISGLIQVQLMLYATAGPFIVENLLHRSALFYGNTALVVGGGYLIGTVISRFLLHYLHPRQVCDVGYLLLFIGLVLAWWYALFAQLTIIAVISPILLTGISGGMVFPHILGANLQLFSTNAGIALAVQAALVLLVSTLGVFTISHVHITNLLQLALIHLAIIVVTTSIFFVKYRKMFASV